MSADLHLHTHYSDGSWAPNELVETAIKLGFQTIAITDHDTTSGIAEGRQAAGNRIDLVSGIELNTIWLDDKGVAQDVHILGYFIDPTNAALQAAIAKQQQARQSQIDKTITLLVDDGIAVSQQLVSSFGSKGTLGRPHLAQALLSVGGAADIAEAYDKLMRHNSPYYVPRLSISPAEAVTAIREAGGVASLAHPGKSDWLPNLIEQLCKCGLSAIEAYHRSHSGTMIRKYMKLARAKGLLVSGGSDCHGPFGEYPASLGSVRVPDSVVGDLRRRLDTCRGDISGNTLPTSAIELRL